jgi:hypothetical protein
MVGQGGEPLYELDVGQRADDAAHLAQFVAHASLDLVEHAGMYVRTILDHSVVHICN